MPVPYRKLTVAIALCGIFTLGIWPAFHSPAIPMDEGMVLVYPEMILKGQLPYRDFESITGPGNSMIPRRSLCRLRSEPFCRTSSGISVPDLHRIGDFRNRAALGSSYRNQLRDPHDRALGRDRSLGKYLVYRPVVRALFALGNCRCLVELALFCRRPPRRHCPLRALRFWTSVDRLFVAALSVDGA